jgi:hypothetical protein
VISRFTDLAKNYVYNAGICDFPTNYLIGIIIPWFGGTILAHTDLIQYIINYTGIFISLFLFFASPMYLWSIQLEESQTYQRNFKHSLKMILQGER